MIVQDDCRSVLPKLPVRRARGWRALALAALYPARWLAWRVSLPLMRQSEAPSVEQRRQDWLHNHAGEPLPAELREAQDA